MYVSYQGQAPGAVSSSTFGYHLGATLEVFNTVLASDDDCWGVVSTTSPNITGNKNGGGCGNYVEASSTNNLAAQYYGTATSALVGSNTVLNGITPVTIATSILTTFDGYQFISHPQWPSKTADFQGFGVNEAASSTCSTVDQCIYDVSDTY